MQNRMDEKGLSLVEVMIAMVVLLFTSLALMQTALVSISANMQNVLRDEAVSVAEMRMNNARNVSLATLGTGDTANFPAGTVCPQGFPTKGLVVTRSVKNVTDFSFCTNTSVTSLDLNTARVIVEVGWIWKGQNYTHTSTSIVRQ